MLVQEVVTPESYLSQLSGNTEHTCGAEKGHMLFFEPIQHEKDPYAP